MSVCRSVGQAAGRSGDRAADRTSSTCDGARAGRLGTQWKGKPRNKSGAAQAAHISRAGVQLPPSLAHVGPISVSVSSHSAKPDKHRPNRAKHRPHGPNAASMRRSCSSWAQIYRQWCIHKQTSNSNVWNLNTTFGSAAESHDTFVCNDCPNCAKILDAAEIGSHMKSNIDGPTMRWVQVCCFCPAFCCAVLVLVPLLLCSLHTIWVHSRGRDVTYPNYS